jgi:prephenate dehydrogenase
LERLGTVAIVGVGLIGGSIGLALRAGGLCGRVVGIGRSATRLQAALALGAIDEATTELTRGVAEADAVVVCTPVTQIAADVHQAAASGPAHLLVTDAGSTKRRIVEAVEDHPRSRAVFVGGHPLAGSERQGVEHAHETLFEGRVCVLTPTAATPPDRLQRARGFWTALGCRIVELDPVAHDEALAVTSHLPHALAAALAAAVPAEALRLAAGAYRDVTRIAASDPALWTAIFLENHAPLLRALDRFESQLGRFRQALQACDEAALRSWWESARAGRSQFDRLNTVGRMDD